MKNLTPELIAKAKAAKSAEELLALAKENNVELTEAEAKTYFEQLNANGAVSDDELGAVAGGGFLGLSCPSEEDNKAELILRGAEFRFKNGTKCPKCQCDRAKLGASGVECLNCATIICVHPGPINTIELI
ncbi:MAG: hypothetical protein IJB94_05745 [Clostridia bacterium]|nr:hypothetical protein [Clostridia bacterium]